MGQLRRIDDPVDERKHDLATALDGGLGDLLAFPAGKSNAVYVYYRPAWSTIPRGIFTTARNHGFVVHDTGTEPGTDIRSKYYAFFGSYPELPEADDDVDRWPYVTLRPASVPTFTCDWCEERKRGETASHRYKPAEQQTEGYPKEKWTLCKDCDPHYDENGNYVNDPDHPKLGGVDV